MSIISEYRLKITRRINLGNYEHIEIEGQAVVSRDNDDDTPEELRARVLDEVNALLDDAKSDHVPKRRQRSDD